jgi:hypothetical protein
VSRFALNVQKRWLILGLVFGVGPLIFYLAFINPAAQRISKYQKILQTQLGEDPSVNMSITPASTREFQLLQRIKNNRLARIKRINSRESLLRFSGALADALAAQARKCGLQVKEVNLDNPSINGKYLPSGQNAIEILNGLTEPQWAELSDPLALPLLKLPFVEVRMTLGSSYAQVFSFVESLPDFPSLVQLTELRTVEDAAGKIYNLRILGYYFGAENLKQTAQLDAPSYR